MIVKKIEVYSTHEKYKRPIPIAVGTHDSRDNVLVRITADNGLFGWGEGSPLLPSYSGEVRDQMVDDIVKRIAPDILGQSISSVNDIMELIEKIRHNKYYFMCAIAGIDISMFDLLGKFRKKPVYELIREHLRLKKFSKTPELPANFTVSRNATKKDDKINEMIKEADKYIRRGYSVIKIKVGVYKKSDVQSVKKLYYHIKRKYNRTVHLFADGNQAYKSVDEALKFILKIKDYVVCLEQPFHRDLPHLSAELYRRLKKVKGAPLLITDEGNSSIEETENILRSNAAGGCLLKMVRSGGFNYVISLVKLLRKYPHFLLGPCSMTETGIGTTANLHAALAVYEHCHPKLGFGFDGPMQVIGESYKNGNDTINYLNKKTGWIIKNNNGISIYDPVQVVGNGLGLGLELNTEYINKITMIKTSLKIKNNKIVKLLRIGKKRSVSIIGNKTKILLHPRY